MDENAVVVIGSGIGRALTGDDTPSESTTSCKGVPPGGFNELSKQQINGSSEEIHENKGFRDILFLFSVFCLQFLSCLDVRFRDLGAMRYATPSALVKSSDNNSNNKLGP